MKKRLPATITSILVLAVPGIVPAQNLFVSGLENNTITQITPGGLKSIFASGLNVPRGLAFNSAGDLFQVDQNSGNIYEYTPGGSRSTFASGLGESWLWLLTAQAICLWGPVRDPPASLLSTRRGE